ncbi:SDR family oxidoreductase [Ferrovibrio terrae]|jgi:3-oxoacyl-[acyl-carrier protein] reductase|uniref:SDR family oxidoreductase n=1 Tax=Ferrovibrio terrae TaxID=2594003 RepID=UPI003137E3C3
MDLGISGRTAIVCAASKGLGRACAEALAAEGVHIILNARDQTSLTATAGEIAVRHGVRVIPVAADLSTEAGRATLLAACPAPDILVNNAGGPPPGDYHSWSAADWEQALNTNMRAPIALIAAYADGMAERNFGRIVNITSSVVRHPIDAQGLSAAARSGLHGFVATIVRGLSKHNVTVNNLLPGPFATDRLLSNFAFRAKREGKPVEDVVAARKAELPAGRFGDPAELGRLCAYLCSAGAGYVSGQSIVLDGAAHPQAL